MLCNKVNRLLNRYIDDELEQRLVDALRQHLDSCPGCQAELDRLKLLKGALQQKSALRAKDDFLDNLRAKLRPETEAVEYKWVPRAQLLARRLIPVPVLTMLLMFLLVFSRMNGSNPIDTFILSNLSNQEIAVLGEYVDSEDLLTEIMFSAS
ncbi:anti-sigma factor family protein [Candidatus Omnitrophota bacterium]